MKKLIFILILLSGCSAQSKQAPVGNSWNQNFEQRIFLQRSQTSKLYYPKNMRPESCGLLGC